MVLYGLVMASKHIFIANVFKRLLLLPWVFFKHLISHIDLLACCFLNYFSFVCVAAVRWDLGLFSLHAVELITHIDHIHEGEGEGEGEAAEWVGRLVLCT